VHSAKDMPTFMPAGIAIAAYLPRADVRDAFIGREARSVEALPQGATVGTASLRRESLLRRARPDLRITLLRGNVQTRLRKVKEGEYEATLLAAAGLKRLGLEDRIDELLPLDWFPPACGQGAVAVACRADDTPVLERLAAIGHAETFDAVTCERAFLAILDGSCRTPIAGLAEIQDGRLSFGGIILSPDGQQFYQASLSGEARNAEGIGQSAGLEIRAQAPRAFLEALGIR
jgi:hydroxymethylbilane synthase